MKRDPTLPVRREPYYRTAKWVLDYLGCSPRPDYTRDAIDNIRAKFLTYIRQPSSTDFSPDQLVAIETVVRWHKDYWNKKTQQQVFRLFGYAGTGKTTLAKEIAFRLKEFVLFTAFTGKACMVLTSKGCRAYTIHSTHYLPEVDEDTGNVIGFRPAEIPASALASLVIVDEASMVNDELGNMLLASDVPILVLGDPFQLPPIEGPGFFDREEPDILLTEVHRNAKDSPVLKLATDVRLGKKLEYGEYGDSMVLPKSQLQKHLMEYDQVLCGKNATRHQVNQWVRGKLGYQTPYVQGERLVCLKNVPNSPIMINGASWTLGNEKSFKEYVIKTTLHSKTQGPEEKKDWVLDARARCVDFEKEDFPYQPISLALGPLTKGHDYPWYLAKKRDASKHSDAVIYPVLHMDYGYCLTVHKAQGSQWDSVAIMNESSVFRENAQRWLYTAITRAAKRVAVFT